MLTWDTAFIKDYKAHKGLNCCAVSEFEIVFVLSNKITCNPLDLCFTTTWGNGQYLKLYSCPPNK